ncbi:MAG: nucleotidyltransferase domain-containing protein [Actinomycetota bacterium]|nr:nucleotidyltransferase domain-containing protein [Actinomycetota bacterium]
MNILSKNKADLPGLFFTNPERSFYIQEIGRILGKKPGTFQRTLNNLISEGILTSEYKGNLRFVKVNKNYPIYNELKSIVFKTVGIQGSIKKILKEIGDIRIAFIYGSYAKSRENILSDVDLLIVGDPDEENLIKKLDSLEEKLKRQINYKLYSFSDFKKEVKEKEPFILRILKDKKIMLVGDKSDLQEVY